jgi:hypothetical protein
MKFKTEYYFCSPRLLENIPEIDELFDCVSAVGWEPEFSFTTSTNKVVQHQTAYNAALKNEFVYKRNWENQPRLHDNPRLIGDFRKNDIFIEVQFGNSSTIYRDYYKFHYGLTHGHLSLAVLIVPTDPKKFFPTRLKSISNMAEFNLADRNFKLLPIPVPIMLIGLLPEN